MASSCRSSYQVDSPRWVICRRARAQAARFIVSVRSVRIAAAAAFSDRGARVAHHGRAAHVAPGTALLLLAMIVHPAAHIL